MGNNRIRELAASLADGEEIPWDEVPLTLTDERDASLLSQLRLVHRIVTIHRQNPDSQAIPTAPKLNTWGHLQILEKIGEGSFGEVYRAWDVTLEREVALKFLNSSKQGIEKQKKTILKEGRLLARIRHPNVVAVHGVAEYDGRVGLWMELVRGKTLKRLLKENGPLGEREAIDIGIDVCGALAAVHQAGLVHRDLKAQNIMREEGGRIVLMDLGLGARHPLAGESSSTLSIAGTPVYMAPELLGGKKATAKSDIYAAGVLLFRLVTGDYPSRARDPARGRGVGAGERGELLRDRRPDLARAFCHVVERALSPDESDRFATAGELQRALEACWGSNVSETPLRVGKLRRFQLPLAASLLLTGSAAMVWLSWNRGSVEVPQGASVLLVDIENRTEDTQLDGVTDLLRNQLNQSRYIDLVETAAIRGVLERMVRLPNERIDADTAREVAWREGIPVVASGNLSQLGTSYLLSLRLEKVGMDPASPGSTWAHSFRTETKDGIFETVDRAGDWIRTTLGEAISDLSAVTLTAQEATTASWEALDLFVRAENLKERDQLEDALLLLEKAVEIDPHFALAHMKMGDILISLGRHSQGYERWQMALSTVGKRRLSRREELRIHGVYAYDTHDFVAAEKTLRVYSFYYPHDYYPYFMHAFSLRAQGRYAEAVERFQEAIERRPSLYYIPAQLARTWMLLGHLELARQEVEKLRQMGQHEWALVMEAACDFLEGNYHEAKQSAARLRSSPHPQWRSEGHTLLARLLAERGHFRQALEVLKEGILDTERAEMAAKKADKYLGLAYLFFKLGDVDAGKAACLEALALERGPQRLARAGSLLAQAGFLGDAAALLDNFDPEFDAPVATLAKNRIKGEILLAQGSYPDALSALREAAELETAYSAREYLARALRESGSKEEALVAYQQIKESPSKLWQFHGEELPGIWGDLILDYAVLACSLQQYETCKEVLNEYLNLREGGEDSRTEADRARQLLHGLENQQRDPSILSVPLTKGETDGEQYKQCRAALRTSLGCD